MAIKDLLGDVWNEELEEKINQYVGSNYVLRADFSKVNQKYKDLQKTQEAKPAEQTDDWQAKYGELEKSLSEKLTQRDSVFNDYRLSAELTKAKARNPKAIKALLDLGKIEFSDNEIKGLDEQINDIKKNEAYLFDIDNGVKAGTGFPAQGNPQEQGTKTIPKVI